MSDKKENLHAGHRQRLLKRLIDTDNSRIIPHEMLEALLFFVIPEKDTNPIAHRLIDSFGSIENALNSTESELQKIKGVGPKTAQYLGLLGKFVDIQNTLCHQKIVYNIADPVTQRYIEGLFSDMEREQVYMLFINSKRDILMKRLMFEGTFENVDIDLNEMLKTAIKYNVERVVCVHNHPSGIARPSRADVKATEAMHDAFKVIGVKLEDHLILTKKTLYGIVTKQRVGLHDHM